MKIIKIIIRWIKRLFKKTEIQNLASKQLQETYDTNKELRDDWLKSTGYTVPRKTTSPYKRPKVISSYVNQVRAFIKAKRKKGFYMYDVRNKQGIPFYEIRTSK